LAEDAEYADICCRIFPCELSRQQFGVALAQRIDYQRAFDFPVAAAQLLFHRNRHSGGIERDSNFTARYGRVMQCNIELPMELRFIGLHAETYGDRIGTAESAAPDRPAAYGYDSC
jgi:hypothetical protein